LCLLDRRRVETDRAVGAAAAQQVEVAALAAGVRARIAEQHEVTVLARNAVDAADDLGVERIAEVGDHREQQAAFGGAQIAREFVDAVAACIDGGEHLVASRGPHVFVRIQHARYGRHRNARLPRHARDREPFRRARRPRKRWRPPLVAGCGHRCGLRF
jgi:hypothetical protein